MVDQDTVAPPSDGAERERNGEGAQREPQELDRTQQAPAQEDKVKTARERLEDYVQGAERNSKHWVRGAERFTPTSQEYLAQHEGIAQSLDLGVGGIQHETETQKNVRAFVSTVLEKIGEYGKYAPLHQKAWIGLLRQIGLKQHADKVFDDYTHNVNFVRRVFSEWRYQALTHDGALKSEKRRLFGERDQYDGERRSLESQVITAKRDMRSVLEHVKKLNEQREQVLGDLGTLEETKDTNEETTSLLDAAQRKADSLTYDIQYFMGVAKEKTNDHQAALATKAQVDVIIQTVSQDIEDLDKVGGGNKAFIKYTDNTLRLIGLYSRLQQLDSSFIERVEKTIQHYEVLEGAKKEAGKQIEDARVRRRELPNYADKMREESLISGQLRGTEDFKSQIASIEQSINEQDQKELDYRRQLRGQDTR